MDYSRKINVPKLTPARIEALEPRRLLAGHSIAFPILIDQPQAVADFGKTRGQGESVVVIDTGVDYLHPAIGTGSGPGNKVIAGFNFVNSKRDFIDTDGHGTGVAWIIGGLAFTQKGYTYNSIAPDVSIIALKIQNTDGNPSTAIEQQAFQWVLDHKTQYNIVAVNLSEGMGNSNSKGSGALSSVLAQLTAQGVFIAASSGNDGDTKAPGVEYPGSDPNVAAVGSINGHEQVSTFTSVGKDLDILAPGENVPTAFLDDEGNPTFLGATGTSFASPYIAAAAALIHQIDPAFTPRQELQIMQQSGTPIYDATYKLTIPLLNLDAALKLAKADAGHAHGAPAAVRETPLAQSSAINSVISSSGNSLFSDSLIALFE